MKGRSGNYVACCPAHDDSSPSMTIKETEDGKILLHCFAGCSVSEVAGAIGIDLSDLFPPRESFTYERVDTRRPKFLASDLLKVIHFEATIVALAAHQMARGDALCDGDMDRLLLAQQRITEALDAAS